MLTLQNCMQGPLCTRHRVAVRGTVLLCRTAAPDTGVKYWMHFTSPAPRKVVQPLKSNSNKRICHFFAWTLIYVVVAIAQQRPKLCEIQKVSARACFKWISSLPVRLLTDATPLKGSRQVMDGGTLLLAFGKDQWSVIAREQRWVNHCTFGSLSSEYAAVFQLATQCSSFCRQQ